MRGANVMVVKKPARVGMPFGAVIVWIFAFSMVFNGVLCLLSEDGWFGIARMATSCAIGIGAAVFYGMNKGYWQQLNNAWFTGTVGLLALLTLLESVGRLIKMV